MGMIERTERVREKVRKLGGYRTVSEKSGVGYEWLAKFARGLILHPRVDKIDKLEKYFDKEEVEE